ncbi:MAG: hypothetical protein AAFY81_06875 [Pseudomonadota bacterium]
MSKASFEALEQIDLYYAERVPNPPQRSQITVFPELGGAFRA